MSRKIVKMYHWLIPILFVCLCPLALVAQESAAQEQQEKKAEQKPARHMETVTGCLQKGDEPGEFSIIGEDGKTWGLHSTSVKLDKHLGHSVTVAGSRTHESKAQEIRRGEKRGTGGEGIEQRGVRRSERHQPEDGERDLQQVSSALHARIQPKTKAPRTCLRDARSNSPPPKSEVVPGHWDMTTMSVEMTGKALLFKSIGVQKRENRRDFHQVSDDLTLTQATDILNRNIVVADNR
jgi:hypothetical protein